jgi:hypothetical protein
MARYHFHGNIEAQELVYQEDRPLTISGLLTGRPGIRPATVEEPLGAAQGRRVAAGVVGVA